MKTYVLHTFVLGLGLMTTLSSSFAAVVSDIPDVAVRRDTVASALRLVEAASIAPLPTGIVNLFNPAAFNQPDADELAALAAAQAADALNSANAKPATETDLLERIADRIVPSGTLTLGDETLLVFGQKRLRVGDHLTVTYEGKDHDLELTKIQRLTFTLRLNRAEITRRINP
jgi:hypothetical protein